MSPMVAVPRASLGGRLILGAHPAPFTATISSDEYGPVTFRVEADPALLEVNPIPSGVLTLPLPEGGPYRVDVTASNGERDMRPDVYISEGEDTAVGFSLGGTPVLAQYYVAEAALLGNYAGRGSDPEQTLSFTLPGQTRFLKPILSTPGAKLALQVAKRGGGAVPAGVMQTDVFLQPVWRYTQPSGGEEEGAHPVSRLQYRYSNLIDAGLHTGDYVHGQTDSRLFPEAAEVPFAVYAAALAGQGLSTAGLLPGARCFLAGFDRMVADAMPNGCEEHPPVNVVTTLDGQPAPEQMRFELRDRSVPGRFDQVNLLNSTDLDVRWDSTLSLVRVDLRRLNLPTNRRAELCYADASMFGLMQGAFAPGSDRYGLRRYASPPQFPVARQERGQTPREPSRRIGSLRYGGQWAFSVPDGLLMIYARAEPVPGLPDLVSAPRYVSVRRGSVTEVEITL